MVSQDLLLDAIFEIHGSVVGSHYLSLDQNFMTEVSVYLLLNAKFLIQAYVVGSDDLSLDQSFISE